MSFLSRLWKGRTPALEPEEASWTWPEEPEAPSPSREMHASTFTGGTGYYDGSNFLGGVSGQIDEISNLDYFTLRARSAAMFYGNLYARGIIRRLVTNVINTGLSVECIPEVSVLGLSEDALVDWSERIERRFGIYGKCRQIIDVKGYRDDGAIQRQIYQESLIGGDCLVINRVDKETDLPQLQIVPGDRVRTPPNHVFDPDVIDGVKVDSKGRHLGYWVYNGTVDKPLLFESNEDGYSYISARGEQSGRKTAWLVYGPDKREDGVRGEPLLGIAIHALKDVLDYRAAASLKAKLNATVVGFVERDRLGPKTMSIKDGAVRRDTIATGDETHPTLQMHELLPGIFMEHLNPGEKPQPYATSGTDVNFGPFEAAVMAGIAWALEIPPEILVLSFRSNYSASAAARQEFVMFLDKERPRFAGEHCQNLFEEWFISELLLGKISAGDFITAYLDRTRYDEVSAWLNTDWSGAIKPSVDIVKQTTGYKNLVKEGWTTNDRASRELTGTKWTENIRRLRVENQLKVEALRPLLEAQQKYGPKEVMNALSVGSNLASLPSVASVEPESVKS